MARLKYDSENDIHEAIGLSRSISKSFEFAFTPNPDEAQHDSDDFFDHVTAMACLIQKLETISQKLRSSK